MAEKGSKALGLVALALLNAAYIWLALPLTAAVCRGLSLAAESARDLPASIAYIRGFVSESLLAGPTTMTGPFGWDTWAGWTGLIAIDVACLWPMASGRFKPPANPVLDALPKPVGGNVYGDAYFLRTHRQLAREARFGFRSIKHLEDPVGGLYLGTDGRHVYMATEDAHMLVLAPTRTGKTQRVILNMICVLGMSDESMVVLDPKGELFGLTSSFLRRRGSVVNRIDYSDPAAGNRFNPLYRAAAAYDRMRMHKARREEVRRALGEGAEEHLEFAEADGAYRDAIQEAEYEVGQLVSMILPRDKDREGDAKFWNDGAESELKKALHYAAADRNIPETQRNLQTALMLLQDYDVPVQLFPANPKSTAMFTPLDELVAQLPREHPAYKAMKANDTATDTQRKSFIQTASSALATYTNYAISQMMQGTDVPIEDLCERKTATFIVIPENKEEYKAYAQLYINQAYSLLVDRANESGGRLPRRITIIGEEFGQVPVIDAVDEKLSISAGRGIRWVLVLQNLAKIDEKYGRDATPVILDNCAYKMILAVDEDQTAKAFSEGFGEYTTRFDEHGSSQRARSWLADSVSTSGRTVKRPLLMPHEMKLWRPEYGAFVVARSQRPAIIPIPMAVNTPFKGMLGLGTQEEDAAKIEAERARKVHPDRTAEPQWRPEYKSRPRHESDPDARRRYDQWIAKISRSARERRGFDGSDAFGGGAKQPSRNGSGSKPDGGGARTRGGSGGHAPGAVKAIANPPAPLSPARQRGGACRQPDQRGSK